MKRSILIVLLVFIIFSIPLFTHAQPPDPCTDPLDPCPIDSNVYFLIAVAVAIAAKKTYDYKKKNVLA